MNVLEKVLCLCRKTEAWLLKMKYGSEPSSSASVYDTLAPKSINDDNLQEYFEALKFALSKKDVRNIAITGNYGAGKSTVVSSFMKYHCPEQYINVSLAGFEMAEKENSPPLTSQEVELSILQQILYKENRDALPDSRIDRILNRSWYHTLKTYLSLLKVAIPMSVLLGVIFFPTVSKWLKLPEEWTSVLNEHYVIKTLILIFLSFVSLFFLTQIASRIGVFDKKIRLGKIALLSGDMELNDKEPSSLLNNCLDEIVYFFSRRPYKIVVFEDLDRLGTPEIFVKLREINKIINNNRSNKTPVRFIYAVRDDMFIDADGRTKFFDFILPVIPFMDSRNAFTLLKNKTRPLSDLNDQHLKVIASYINDMRSLINIVNEFYVFSKVVDNSKATIKLFALVFYKNIYALDYHLADKKTGVLYSFIHNYRIQKLHEEYFESLDEQLEILYEKALKLESEIASTSEDVRKELVISLVPEILWGKVFIATTTNHRNFDSYDSAEMIRNESYFIDIFSTTLTLCVGYSGPYNSNHFSVIDENQKRNFIKNYNNRKKLLGEDKNSAFQALNIKIRNLENTIRARNATPLDALIRNGGRDKFELTANQYLDELEHHEFVSKEQLRCLRTDMQYGGLDALYALLTSSLIMQDFMSYRSIFHEGSMTVNDNDFIKAIGQDLGCEKSNQEFYIDDPEKVIAELLEQKRIYADGALHHQLLTHIHLTDNECFTNMIASLFAKPNPHIYKVFEVLYLKFAKPELFDDFVIRSLKISSYLERMLWVLKDNHEKPFNKIISITVLASTSPELDDEITAFREYLHFLGADIIRIIRDDKMNGFLYNLKKAEVCYAKLFSPYSDFEYHAIRYIAEHRLYMLNRDNVGVVISACVDNEHRITPEEARNQPWTLINHYNLKHLISYFLDNIDAFAQNVFIFSKETSESIGYMIFDSELNDQSKEMIIKDMEFTISEFPEIRSDSSFIDGASTLTIYDLLFKFDRVIPSWPIILDYLSGDCNESTLQQWIINHANDVGCYSDNVHGHSQFSYLYEKVICNDYLDDRSYLSIISSVNIDAGHIDEQLSFQNFSRLVSLRKIILNETIYQKIEEIYNYQDAHQAGVFIHWFGQFKDVFLEEPVFYLRQKRNTSFFDESLNMLMTSNYFNETEKARLVIIFSEHYLDTDLTDINLPWSVAIQAIGYSDNITLQAVLLAALISDGYKNRTKIAELCLKINEPELSNVFVQRTQATIKTNNDDLVYLILERSRDAGLIRTFDRRDDGKITVTLVRDKEEDN